MELTNTRLVPAPLDAVWQGLNDPETLKACVPGCESFEKSGENEYVAVTVAKVGPVSAKFTGKITLADIHPPTGYTLRFEGQGGAAGFAKGEAVVSLAPADGGQTAVTYTAKAQVGGKLAQIGSRLVDGAAAKLADDFFARFAERVGAPQAEIASSAPALQPVRPPQGAKYIRWVAIAAIVALLAYLYAAGLRVK
jgi:carbon monoxide dehydrogenase subunit G